MATITLSNPEGAPKPAPSYSQCVLVTGEAKRLVISGQVGIQPDGTILDDPEAQVGQVFANIGAILKAHGMTPANLVKTTVFLTDAALLGALRAKRSAFMQGHTPASTLLIVAGLADPRFKVEVEAEAVA